MGTFRTIAKLWPSGTELDLGDDTNDVSGAATFLRNAPPFVTTDGTNQFQFLFWNTGRHLTRKRRVRWLFSVLGWSLWTATKWYGTPSGGGKASLRVRADGLAIGTDTPFSDSPIDAAASTFTPASAHPFNGSDHEIGTAGGPVTVAARDPFHGLEFAGWLQLIFGGDPTGEFVESDVGDTPGSSGFGVFEHVPGLTFNAPQNSTVDLVAAYGNTADDGLRIPQWLTDIFIDIGFKPGRFKPNVDPIPPDLLRLRLLDELVKRAQPGTGGDPGADFQNVIQNVSRMSKDDLKRSLQSIQTSLDLANTAKAAVEAQLRK